MKKVAQILVLAFVLSISISCDKTANSAETNELIGYWKQTEVTKSYYLVYEFRNDNKGSYKVYETRTGDFQSDTDFSYTLSGTDLSINDREETVHYTILILTDKTLQWQDGTHTETYSKIE